MITWLPAATIIFHYVFEDSCKVRTMVLVLVMVLVMVLVLLLVLVLVSLLMLLLLLLVLTSLCKVNKFPSDVICCKCWSHCKSCCVTPEDINFRSTKKSPDEWRVIEKFYDGP